MSGETNIRFETALIPPRIRIGTLRTENEAGEIETVDVEIGLDSAESLVENLIHALARSGRPPRFRVVER